MYKGKKILAIIPARGGSKGLPKKNILPLLNKPLLSWTIEKAMESKYLDYVLVSTDDSEIAEIANFHGLEVPFLRPGEISQDSSPVSDTIIHAIQYFEQKGMKFDYIALLEPTSPMRKDSDIDDAIESLINSNVTETLVSVGEIHTEHPIITKKIIDEKVIPYFEGLPLVYQRQQTDSAYFPYGVIYLSSVSSFKVNKSFYLNNTMPYFIERWQNYEIDDIYDFYCVENILKYKLQIINK